MTKSKGELGRNIFVTGEYVQHFTPDEKRNPFWRIYKKKKQDTLDIIHKLNPDVYRKRILDVGGGMGRLSLKLSESAQNMTVLADIGADMLKLAIQQSGADTKLVCVNADAHRLPFRDKSFDLIAALDLLCHLEKPLVALAEFNRILSDRGSLIMDSTNSNPLWAIFYPRYLGRNPMTWFKVMRLQGILPGWENIVRHYSKQTFLGFLRDSGFEVTKVVNYGPRICPKWNLAISRKKANPG
jgi:ubiquinone/menaquinone biosynthesis C-methylase UbiE